MLVWLQHEKDCFDNPTTYLPYMEGKADSKQTFCNLMYTVEPLIKGPLRRGQPLYSGQNGWSQSVLYSEVPLYIRKRITSLQWTKWLVPKCPLFGGSTVHKEEDNLSIVDKMAGPKVSFIRRFHCI